MVIKDCLGETTRTLGVAGVDSARLDALLLLEYVMGRDRAWLLAHFDSVLSPQELDRFKALVARRVKREPLAYLTGQAWFYGHKFAVSPSVLIPRPETEQLVEAVLALSSLKARILEIGTGSGAIAVSLQIARPDLRISATDVAAEALTVAARNARALSCEAMTFIQTDLLQDIQGPFDILVANLPYIAQGQDVSPETAWEPDSALYAGPDGLEIYRRLFGQLAEVGLSASHLVLEAEPDQQQVLTKLAEAANYQLQSREEFCYVFSFLEEREP
jgi:release factor glutamine methyltransferase